MGWVTPLTHGGCVDRVWLAVPCAARVWLAGPWAARARARPRAPRRRRPRTELPRSCDSPSPPAPTGQSIFDAARAAWARVCSMIACRSQRSVPLVLGQRLLPLPRVRVCVSRIPIMAAPASIGCEGEGRRRAGRRGGTAPRDARCGRAGPVSGPGGPGQREQVGLLWRGGRERTRRHRVLPPVMPYLPAHWLMRAGVRWGGGGRADATHPCLLSAAPPGGGSGDAAVGGWATYHAARPVAEGGRPPPRGCDHPVWQARSVRAAWCHGRGVSSTASAGGAQGCARRPGAAGR